jgi:hypothetical protein
LERAAITAFRHAALKHWRTINAQNDRPIATRSNSPPSFTRAITMPMSKSPRPMTATRPLRGTGLRSCAGSCATSGASACGGLHVAGSGQPSLAVRSRTTDALAQEARAPTPIPLAA